MEKRLFKPEEAAAALGIARSRIYAYIASGELGSIKIGTSRRIPAADLDAFVQRLRSEQARDGAARHDSASAHAAA